MIYLRGCWYGFLMLVVLSGWTGFGYAAPIDDLVAAAKKEGVIEFYAPNTLTPQGAQAYTEAVNKRYGLNIKMNYSAAGNMTRDIGLVVGRAAMGVEKGVVFMKQLAKQEPVILRDQRLLAEWVARGKYAAALAPDRATTAPLIRAGAPLEYPDLKESRPISTGAGNLMIVDRTPHPNATRLFANWILSKEGAVVYSKAHGVPSPRLDVSTEGIDSAFMPKANENILGEEYQIAKGEMRKLAAEVFRDLIK